MAIQYWANRMGEGGKYIKEAKKGNYIAIGWELGDLTWILDPSGDDDKLWGKLGDLVKNTYGGTNVSVGISTGQVYSFSRVMKIGDIVLVPDFNKGQLLVGEIKGHYEFNRNWGDKCPYPNRRKVEWKSPINTQGMPIKLKNSFYSWLTVFNVDHHSEEIARLISGGKPPEEKGGITGEALYQTIINRVMDLHPKEFEEFMAHLLSTIGFQAAATQYVGDKGVDVIGVLNAEGVAKIILHLQVKRMSSTIGIGEVLKIRGTLAGDEHGAIVTTSKFTHKAREESESERKKKIALIDGKALVDLILNHYSELDKKYQSLLHIERKEIPIVEQFSIIS